MEFLVLAFGIVFIVLAIAVLKMHPFIALILAGFLVGVLSPLPLDLESRLEVRRDELRQEFESGKMTPEQLSEALATVPKDLQQRPSSSRQAVDALEFTAIEFGSTAASIGIVIVLAAIIGQCLLESGAADRISRNLLRWLGEKNAPTSLMASGYFLSIPVFFDTVFFLLIPLARALRVRTRANYITYVMAISGGAVISHSLVPPTPGPLIMVENFSRFDLTLGKALLIGAILGIVPALIGLVFARFVNGRLKIPFREVTGSSREQLEELVRREDSELPSFSFSILPVISPVILIASYTIADTIMEQRILALSAEFMHWMSFLGNKNFALLFGAACAVVLLKKQRKYSLQQLSERLEPAIMSAGVIILITSAGGAFGKMLARVGIADALQRDVGTEQFTGIILILLAWSLSAIMKIAQGSGTVAMITASAMIASLLANTPLPIDPIYLYAAIGFGSLFVSWMNDSAFWVICKMSGFTEKETLSTWTPLMGILGITGLIQVIVLSLIV